ncbi:MAG: hypothetical protein NZ955_01875 [Candidatus Bathyarchaeota archaeon]|nr:hypothetical protein [Candidatus Bathyarchaeota archaeon]
MKSGVLRVAVVGYSGSPAPLAYAYGRIGARVSVVDMDVCSAESFVKMVIGSRYSSAISRLLRSGMICVASDRIEAISESDIIDIFVPIRFSEVGRPDYSILYKLSEEVGRGLSEGKLIISSTITPPGMTEDVIVDLLERFSGLKAGDSFGLAYTPYEPLQMEGSDSTVKILAAVDKRSLDIAEAIVSTVYGCKIFKIDSIRCAEAIKLFDSVSKYILHAFTYELIEICGRLGLDNRSLNYSIEALYSSSYQTPPNWAYLSENAKLLLDLCEAYKLKPKLLDAALRVGESISRIHLSMIREAAKQIGKPLRRCSVALIGQPDRTFISGGTIGSPTIDLALRLRKMKVYVKVFDPYALEEPGKAGFKVSRRIEECLEGADIIVILPESRYMKNIIIRKLGVAKALAKNNPVIVDLAGIIDRVEVSRLGFVYLGLDGVSLAR